MKRLISRKSSKSSVKANDPQPASPPLPIPPSPLPRSPSQDATSPPPLYARFARGDTTPDFREPLEPLKPPVRPQTLNRGSVGSGFRSSSVDEEVERYAVVKKNTSGRDSPARSRGISGPVPLGTRSKPKSALSIQTNANGNGPAPISPPVSPTISRSRSKPRAVPVIQTIVPRPPTPPPPSPPKAKYTRLPSTPLSANLNTSPFSSTKTPSLSLSDTLPQPDTAPLTPPALPFTPRRAYSPLAAFGPLPPKAKSIRSPSVSPPPPPDRRDPSPPSPPQRPPSPPVSSPADKEPVLSPANHAPSPSPTSQELLIPDISALNLPKRSPEFGPGLASQLRAVSRGGTPTDVPQTPSLTGGYFSMYPERNARGRTRERQGLQSPETSEDGQTSAPMPTERRGRGSASERMQARQARWRGMHESSAPLVNATPLSVAAKADGTCSKANGRRSPVSGGSSIVPARRSATRSRERVTPLGDAKAGVTPPGSGVSATPLPASPAAKPQKDLNAPSKPSYSTSASLLSSPVLPAIEDDALRAFAANLPGTFGDVTRRVPRGARLSQQTGKADPAPLLANTPAPSLIDKPAATPSPAHDRMSSQDSFVGKHRQSAYSSYSQSSITTFKSQESSQQDTGSQNMSAFSGEEKVETMPSHSSSRKLRTPSTPTGQTSPRVPLGSPIQLDGEIGKGDSPFELDVDLFVKLPVNTNPPKMNGIAPLQTERANGAAAVENGRKESLPGQSSGPPRSEASVPQLPSPLTRTPSQIPKPITPAEARARLLRREPKSLIDASAPPSALLPRLPVSPQKVSSINNNAPDVAKDLAPQPPPGPVYPVARHLTHPYLLYCLLQYLSYTDFCSLLALNKVAWRSLNEVRDLREEVLERYLRTVGYVRWGFKQKEPLVLTLKDLNCYLRGVSMPTHEYATIAEKFLAQVQAGEPPSSSVTTLSASCRSFTRLVLRLRAQAEAEHAARGLVAAYHGHSPSPGRSQSRSRRSSMQTKRSSAQHSADSHWSFVTVPQDNGGGGGGGGVAMRRFSSPLFRLNHAPLLRLFVPSPNGVWLSDESVVECEKELKRSGVLHLLRPGDVVWDTAIPDEMNAGRLVWDGNYLIDLEFNYSPTGELPRYLHSLAFPPSYFHNVIRSRGNPLCQIDLSPWGAEVAANVQLVQDRVMTETPQGSHHTVLRWAHRTRFVVQAGQAIPQADGRAVDPKWVGAVFVEAEGTNEGLADLLGRCGEAASGLGAANPGDACRVFRLLRDRSRPGEIWLRCVREKERIA